MPGQDLFVIQVMFANSVKTYILIPAAILLFSCSRPPGHEIRQEVSLNTGWKTIADDTDPHAFDGFEESRFDDRQWISVDVPHNWDAYHGYLRKLHGNLHGTAWYRKSFRLDPVDGSKRIFLFFEGVGSYATVWVNGRKMGYHAGGRTSFTLEITDAVVYDEPNVLAVRADHPAKIRDLPWVCGGCSDEWGFSEGSQPMGIFRPVTLIITGDIRIEPFGIHIWNDADISDKEACLHINTEVRNYSENTRKITLVNTLMNETGRKVAETTREFSIAAGTSALVKCDRVLIKDPVLWSPRHPCLYTLRSSLLEDGRIRDETETVYGIRSISWPVSRKDGSGQFLINGEPFFINGIGEYEHLFGRSHAFTEKQIQARTSQVKAAGFNAFRDAHQPHNLRYQQIWDREGMLWWPQMSAHIWFDNEAFRENFKTLLRDWVRERRNSPGNIMWGLQNESVLPEDFARECVEIIRELDPTSSSQRIITTCNGGSGTDWNVVQNWSGTYGGDPYRYEKELSLQLLNGEYGAWRSIDLHSEGPFDAQGILSEDRMTQLLQMKIRQAESVKDRCCGQFLWLLSSHDNPGRIQNGEGLRDMDRIGPVNYKGLLTPWGEPLDAFYMYRAAYAPKEMEPMVYIVSHSWPNRWYKPGIKDSILVYSNCDEVELFNDMHAVSLGRKKNRGRGYPFLWERAEVRYNVLQAVGYVNGRAVARDLVVLNHLPQAPRQAKQHERDALMPKARKGFHYLYRVNCGGPDYTDQAGNTWTGDRHQESDSTWGSLSWTDSFEGIPPFYASQRRSFDPVDGTSDPKLFQTFRYGLDQLSFNFPLPNGEYRVELYFTEPWYGTGGGMNCRGWRIFDVAVNNIVVLKDLDIWDECGHDKALCKEFTLTVTGGMLRVHFPVVSAGQAIISALAIASKEEGIRPSPPSPGNITGLKAGRPENHPWSTASWLDIGDKPFAGSEVRILELPSLLFGTEWIRTPSKCKGTETFSFVVREESELYVALHPGMSSLSGWMKAPLALKTDDGLVYGLYSKRALPGSVNTLDYSFSKECPANGTIVFVLPVSALGTPSDQRPLTSCSAEKAKIHGSSVVKKQPGGRSFIELIHDTDEEIEWPFVAGLAGTYTIHFKFQNNSGRPITGSMIIETAGGFEMHHVSLSMESRGIQWQTLKTGTGTSLNAGDYRIRLKLRDAKGLKIERMDIQ